jgi:hypothetical protein
VNDSAIPVKRGAFASDDLVAVSDDEILGVAEERDRIVLTYEYLVATEGAAKYAGGQIERLYLAITGKVTP